jgi:single-stranded-DNA-specific exonuclease
MTPEELLERLLEQRGIIDPQQRESFLHPQYQDLFDPFLMHDMKQGIDRILQAIDNQELICIYSDYDADGIPGGVIFHDFFKKINYPHFFNYIPHRHHEGYGLHRDALEKIAQRGARLVITVDLGITAVNEVVDARTLGMDVIITDHHEPLEQVPDAFAVINPKLGTYPDRMLCGAGVAFKVVQALLQSRAWPDIVVGWEKWLLDMAGLATLSDMVPLMHENRIIAYYGMKVLAKTPRPGLRALYEQAGIHPQTMNEEDVVFSITPRLNAAGRMAHPDDAFQTLATSERVAGIRAAQHLSSLNDERKKIVARIMKEVHKKVHLRMQQGELPQILVLGDPAWSAGILGLVASKIIETYHVTTFVWGAEGEVLKGSCRGYGDISVVKLMERVAHKFVQFGGHEEAGGFTMVREEIHDLESCFLAEYHHLAHEQGTRRQKISGDLTYSLRDVSMKHYRSLRAMAPFGVGNPKPLFIFSSVRIESVKQFGKTKEHLEIRVSQDGSTQRAIRWFATPESFTRVPQEGEMVTLLAEFDYSVFRGKEELRLRIQDIQ